MCGLAIDLTVWLQGSPAFHRWHTGQSVTVQVGVVVGFALLGSVCAFLALRLPFIARRLKLPPALSDFDLSGYRPFAIGLAAGVGEELLFRAALLPLAGLMLSSLLFALAHARTSKMVNSPIKRVAYIANTFVAGIVLGLIFNRIGLIAVIGIHAIIDIVGLSLLQRLPREIEFGGLTLEK